MKIDEESNIIKESIKDTIDDLREFPENFNYEEDVQLRLYIHLCNKFHQREKGSFGKIKLEYNPFSPEQRKKNHQYASRLTLDKSFFKHLFKPIQKKYNIQPNNFKELISKFIVQGQFDIVIFNENDELRHAIEIKRLCEAAVHPELKSETHRPLEDIYVLTDLLKPKYSSGISEDARGYNLIYIETKPNTSKSKSKDKCIKMNAFIKDIVEAYDKAGLYHLAIEPDEISQKICP